MTTEDRAGAPRRVLLLFGGRSSEHAVSCLSARSVLAALDPARYAVTCVGITREGRWTLVDGVPEGDLPVVGEDGDTVALVRGRRGARLVRFRDDADPAADPPSDRDPPAPACEELAPVDVCFPVLHGPYGEDGTVQGLLASLGVPYVGADVASSAVAVDKRQMKNVFTARGLPQVPYRVVGRTRWEEGHDAPVAELEAALRYPVFTKPARQGSSIGIRRCADRAELVAGVEEAFGYDRVAIVEQGVVGVRELECGVLGNSEIEVTPPGEIRTTRDFYDFEGKYLDADLSLQCPADVPADVTRRCTAYARDAYHAIGARGMARVDFFYVEATGEVMVNEINTIPGFTPVSMFPFVWKQCGVGYPELVARLLTLAVDAARAEDRHAP